MLMFAQMRREVLTYNGVQYLKYTPTTKPVKGAILFLHGMGERGSDVTLLERTEIPKLLKEGMEVPYIVVAPQLPANFGGWYGNITYPMVELVKSFGVDVHLTGLSLGAMTVPSLVAEKPGVFKTAATVCGFVDGSDATKKTAIFNEFRKIPSIHYYDPGDNTIAYGYLSIKEMTDKLKAEGKDIALVTWPGKGHSIWDESYAANQYWAWLDTKTSAQPAPPSTVTIDKQYRVGNDMFIESGGQVFKVALTPN
jgi:predicted peptidase